MGEGSSDQRSGVCHISPLLREALSGIFLSDAGMDGGLGGGGGWCPGTCQAYSMVLADATKNFSFKESGWNECCISLKLPGVLRPSGTQG